MVVEEVVEEEKIRHNEVSLLFSFHFVEEWIKLHTVRQKKSTGKRRVKSIELFE